MKNLLHLDGRKSQQLFLVMLLDGKPTELMAAIFPILVYSALFCVLASMITTIFLLVKFVIKDMYNEYKDDTKWYIHDTIPSST